MTPLQSYCNYITLAFRNLASLDAENVGVGTLSRSGFVLAPTGPNNEGYPSSAVANGPSSEPAGVGSKEIINNDHLHANPYPNVAGPGQPKICEAGNETYVPGQLETGNLPSSEVANRREITKREENLFGEKYPAATLKALGLSGGSSKGTGT